jgi:hypothetical protein
VSSLSSCRIERLSVFLDTSFETPWGQKQWSDIAAEWPADVIDLKLDKDDADVILVTIADPRIPYRAVIESLSAYPIEKLCVFDPQDSPIGLYPGIYAQLRAYLFNKRKHRSGSFMQSFNDFICFTDPNKHPVSYLFSFQGNATSHVRQSLFNHAFDRPDILIERTEPFWDRIGSPEMLEFKKRYAETIASSRFVLCPRGIGTSSFRLFEVMQSGRVPVVLADAWVPCRSIDWANCSLRVREKDISKIIAICEDASSEWPAMALSARRTWEEWFSRVGLANQISANLHDIDLPRTRLARLYDLYVDRPTRRFLVAARQRAVGAASRFRGR